MEDRKNFIKDNVNMQIKNKGLVKFSFYLLGSGGLLVWNAILSNFDLFTHFVKYKLIRSATEL
jgi:hypothetical protein